MCTVVSGTVRKCMDVVGTAARRLTEWRNIRAELATTVVALQMQGATALGSGAAVEALLPAKAVKYCRLGH